MSFHKLFFDLALIILFGLIIGVVIFLLLPNLISCEGLGCIGVYYIPPIFALPLGTLAGLFAPKIFKRIRQTDKNNRESFGRILATLIYTSIAMTFIIASNVALIILMNNLGAFSGRGWYPETWNYVLASVLVIADLILLIYVHHKIDLRSSNPANPIHLDL